MNKLIRLSQNDPRWAKVRIGKSNSFIGGNGCTITSLAMAINKLNRDVQVTPDFLAKSLSFVAVPGDPDPRYLDWVRSKPVFDSLKVEFVDRHSYTASEHYKRLAEYANSAFFAVLLQVRTKSGGQHWLFANASSAFDFQSHDPWDGTSVWKTAGFLGKYPRITGYCVFKRKTGV